MTKQTFKKAIKNSFVLGSLTLMFTLTLSVFGAKKANANVDAGQTYRILLNDFSGCWNRGGNCLPTVIITPPSLD